MSYVTPVKDHDAADYFNVADWTRIYGNARVTNSLAAIMLDEAIAFTTVAAPTTATNPTSILSMVNSLCVNIELMRLAMAALLPTLTEVKDDWVAGPAEQSPSYTHVNQWETTIDAIWDYYSGDTLEVCPTLATDLIVPTGTTKIIVDCVRVDNYKIIPEGTGKLAMI